jgi:DNA repair protein RadC
MRQVLTIQEPQGSVKDASDLFNKVKKIDIDYTQENLVLVCLNTKNQVVDSKVLFKGGLDCCIIDQKILFRHALINNSSKIIIAHNHPSGNLEPSYEDKDIYKRLKEIGETLGMPVLDSIVFNEDEFYSLDSGGLND